MSVSGIHGHVLEVTGALKDTEWLSRQDPYVCLEYGSTKYRTRTCTDGGKAPVFQERFTFTLIEGLREINVVVWNSNTLTYDDFIGSGKIQLQKVLSQGFDDTAWSLQTKTGRTLFIFLHIIPESQDFNDTALVTSKKNRQICRRSTADNALRKCQTYPPPPSAYPPPPSTYPPPPPHSSYPPSTYPQQSPYYPPGPFPGHYPPPPY
ncbi:hypothetical protein GOBAR_AA32403 [Gossypium barbadense]|uniref:C2 domain-containing protein n=1 Tax=Gossypium barbadense TaxID=3634 RepID=A0A2P5WB10_GOSBA|nr:hypothetical protein GOBAR_AA32403 [Gossypium barbadense]